MTAVYACPELSVLPIIFIPGIMGSRLRQRRSGRVVWDPPVNWRALGHYFSGAQERRRDMIGPAGTGHNSNFLSVDYGRVGGTLNQRRIDRNWGGVHQPSYLSFLSWLEHTAATPGGGAPVPTGCFNLRYEVWAYPYNWSNTNRDSGAGIGSRQSLSDLVDTAVAECHRLHDGTGRRVLKPVLLTHSMGGLVARAFCKLSGGEGKVHGVIHGAMPTEGAPATYKRMRAGFEGAASMVLGWNAAEVTTTAGNMPGALELLPNRRHKRVDGTNRWLRVTDRDATDLVSKPTSDPYSEVYLNQTDWWRLIDARLLDAEGDRRGTSAFGQFRASLGRASRFHADLGANGFHANTRMFFSQSGSHLSWDKVDWRGRQRGALRGTNDSAAPNGTGTVDFIEFHRSYSEYDDGMTTVGSVEIRGPTAAGDGTVHAGSGIHATPMHVATSNGFEHGACYDSSTVRRLTAQWLFEMAEEQM